MSFTEYVWDRRSEWPFWLSLFLVSYKVIVYTQRLFFSPLSRFPGPKLCAASRIYEFYYDCVLQGRFWAQLPKFTKQYGPVVRIGPNEVFIGDSTFVDQLIGYNQYDKIAIAAEEFGVRHALFGTKDYKEWSVKRSAFGDAFSKTKALKLTDMMQEKIDQACERMKENAENGKPSDLAYLYRAVPAEITTRYLFGTDYGFLDDEEFTKGLYDKSYDGVFGLNHLGRFIPGLIPMLLSFARMQIKKILGFKEPGSSLFTFFLFATKLVQETEQKHKDGTLATSGINHPILFEDFFNSSLPPSYRTANIMGEHAMAIWSGGWESPAFTLTLGTFEILRNPHIKQQLVSELTKVWPNARMPCPDFSIIGNLPYLDAFIRESLRMAPGALSRIHRVNRNGPIVYKGMSIPAGTQVCMSLHMINQDPAIWGPDAGTFRPERWIEADATTLAKYRKYMVSFSKGTRICPGMDYALIMVKLILATFLRRFDLSLQDGVKIEAERDIYPYYDYFTPGARSKKQCLPVMAKDLR